MSNRKHARRKPQPPRTTRPPDELVDAAAIGAAEVALTAWAFTDVDQAITFAVSAAVGGSPRQVERRRQGLVRAILRWVERLVALPDVNGDGFQAAGKWAVNRWGPAIGVSTILLCRALADGDGLVELRTDTGDRFPAVTLAGLVAIISAYGNGQPQWVYDVTGIPIPGLNIPPTGR